MYTPGSWEDPRIIKKQEFGRGGGWERLIKMADLVKKSVYYNIFSWHFT